MTPTTARGIKVLVAGTALLGSLAIGLAPAGAEPNAGDLDVTFNGTGVAETAIRSDISADDIARTPDGRLLAVADGSIWRFNADGTLDTSFGANGLVDGAIAGGLSARRLEVLPDGRFVVAGFVSVPGGPTIGAARFLADGTLDSTFFGRDGDGDGVADQIPVFPPGLFDISSSTIDLVVQSTGHVVVFGLEADQDFFSNPAAGRISPDGVAGDVVVISPPSTADTSFQSFDAGIGPGDRVVLAIGGSAETPNSVVVAARLEPDLGLDPTFGGDGFDILPDPNDEVATNGNFAVTALADGTVAAIASQLGELDGVFLIRWDRTGRFLGRTAVEFADAIDQAFAGSLLSAGANGFIVALTLFDGDSSPNARSIAAVRFDAAGREVRRTVVERPGSRLNAVAATSDVGGVVIAGDVEAAEGRQLMLTRVTAQPELDTSFGVDGLATFTGGSTDAGESVAVSPDGGVLVAGNFDASESTRGFVLRHEADGRLDSDFGGNVLFIGLGKPGVALFDHAVHGVTVDAQGRIIVVGEDFDGDDGEFGTVTRLLPDGTADPSFGFEGESRIPAPEDDIRLNAVTVDAEGRIVVVGTSEVFLDVGIRFEILVMRLLPNGDADPDFNDGEPRLVASRSEAAEGRAVAVQPDGRIVVVGSNGQTIFEDPCCREIVIVRLDDDGAFDTEFNNGNEEAGIRPETIGDALNRATGVAVKPDGRIVVAGFASDFVGSIEATPPYVVVLQLLPDGTRDPAFGDNGLFTSEGRVSALVGGLTVDGAGNAVVAGSGGASVPTPQPEADDIVLVRVTPAGGFDAGFGDNGVVWTDLGGVEAAAGVAIDADGRIVIGGSNRDARGSRALAARYHSVTVVEQPPQPPEPPEEPEQPEEPEGPEPPAQPPTVFAPAVSFNPGVGRAGQATTATGTGFPPGATITFDWSQGIDTVAPVVAGADGSFTVGVLVLPSEIFGNRLLTATTTDPATRAAVTATAPYLVAIGTSQPGDFVGRR